MHRVVHDHRVNLTQHLSISNKSTVLSVRKSFSSVLTRYQEKRKEQPSPLRSSPLRTYIDLARMAKYTHQHPFTNIRLILSFVCFFGFPFAIVGCVGSLYSEHRSSSYPPLYVVTAILVSSLLLFRRYSLHGVDFERLPISFPDIEARPDVFLKRK